MNENENITPTSEEETTSTNEGSTAPKTAEETTPTTTVTERIALRTDVIPFMNLGSKEAPDWTRCGRGWKKFQENPNAQTESEQYINEESETTDTVGYSPQYNIECNLMYTDPTIKKVYTIAKDRLTGSDAVLDMLIVDKFDGTEESCTARRESLAVAISSIDGTKKMAMSGNLNCQGGSVKGKFNLKTNTFTADTSADA